MMEFFHDRSIFLINFMVYDIKWPKNAKNAIFTPFCVKKGQKAAGKR
ncbi:hypothetical protein BRO54_3765 [Geobacillus proteiniphilus]|uniref:Uncharacterized protein n=1 Tax=Geobacillus proteiniphilus TaxID=860353 RepID=A0A1Q5SJ70_9BACL|nr:hypothetical protein BRO54_3765 [Geobacillus proteiniphilus]